MNVGVGEEERRRESVPFGTKTEADGLGMVRGREGGRGSLLLEKK